MGPHTFSLRDDSIGSSNPEPSSVRVQARPLPPSRRRLSGPLKEIKVASSHPVLRALLIAAAVLGRTGTTSADPLASYRAADVDIVLMTNPCVTDSGRAQMAVRRSRGHELGGCWRVNARGNPFVTWSDGTAQELTGSRVKLAPKYAAMLDDTDRAPGPPSASGADAGYPRPSWCKSARFPHERLICDDPRLAAADLSLGPLWRAYRRRLELSGVQQARQRADYFKRLRACGAHPECIAQEQSSQMRLYRQALAQAAPPSERRD